MCDPGKGHLGQRLARSVPQGFVLDERRDLPQGDGIALTDEQRELRRLLGG